RSAETVLTRASETVPRGVRADENDAIGKPEIDGPCLPPATLYETARFDQRVNLLGRIRPKNTNRLSKERIHHTEPPIGERGDFRERGKILGPLRAQILQQADRVGKRSPVAGENHVLRGIAPRVVTRDRVSGGIHPP